MSLFKYRIEKNIYYQGLSPNKIYKGILNGLKVAIKETSKARLSTPIHHEFVKNELAIHYSLSKNCSCENITKVYDYFEDETKYYLIMEYSPEPDYFEDLLENVLIINIRNIYLLVTKMP
jgi:serine/threonine protein kinase